MKPKTSKSVARGNWRIKGWNSLYWKQHASASNRIHVLGTRAKNWRQKSAEMLGLLSPLCIKGKRHIFIKGEEIGNDKFRFDSIEDYKDVEILERV
ncbi:hypothetical protein [Dubosiella newyorkensis]|uniref:hypothetical protein n=1 Tax=Dubosiella newyorkensis TaxID=1862672 RepID=UPI003F665C39